VVQRTVDHQGERAWESAANPREDHVMGTKAAGQKEGQKEGHAMAARERLMVEDPRADRGLGAWALKRAGPRRGDHVTGTKEQEGHVTAEQMARDWE